jgi:hypothetical protein
MRKYTSNTIQLKKDLTIHFVVIWKYRILCLTSNSLRAPTNIKKIQAQQYDDDDDRYIYPKGLSSDGSCMADMVQNTCIGRQVDVQAVVVLVKLGFSRNWRLPCWLGNPWMIDPSIHVVTNALCTRAARKVRVHSGVHRQSRVVPYDSTGIQREPSLLGVTPSLHGSCTAALISRENCRNH